MHTRPSFTEHSHISMLQTSTDQKRVCDHRVITVFWSSEESKTVCNTRKPNKWSDWRLIPKYERQQATARLQSLEPFSRYAACEKWWRLDFPGMAETHWPTWKLRQMPINTEQSLVITIVARVLMNLIARPPETAPPSAKPTHLLQS